MVAVLRQVDRAFWIRALAWAVAIALVTGVPTVLVPNTFFSRTIPTSAWQYLVWGLISALGGLVMAARKLPGQSCAVGGKTAAGSGFTYLAVACPVCNKLIVGVLGVSGALSYFAPLQPLLGAVALMLIAVALRRSLSGVPTNLATADSIPVARAP